MYLTFAAFVCRFTLHIPENLEMKSTAPLLCAGITTYSPLMHYGLNKPGMKIGVIGLGGLGHMAVKIAKAMGVEVSFYCKARCGCASCVCGALLVPALFWLIRVLSACVMCVSLEKQS